MTPAHTALEFARHPGRRQAAQRRLGRAARRAVTWAALALATVIGAAPAGAAPAIRAAPFPGLVEIRADDILDLPRWNEVRTRLASQLDGFAECRARGCDRRTERDLADLLAGLAAATPAHQVAEVNRFVNRRPYVEDVRLFGRPDVWQPALDFLANAGDCEDFAIAKYFALRALGFEDDRLRIVVGLDRRRAEPHAVLTVVVEGRPLVLDSLDPQLSDPRGHRHFEARYAVNLSHTWIYHPDRPGGARLSALDDAAAPPAGTDAPQAPAAGRNARR